MKTRSLGNNYFTVDIYLKPTRAIDSDNEQLIKTAKELTLKYAEDHEKAVSLFYFVRDEIKYNPYMISTYFEDFIASKTLERKKGYCVQKAILLAALARAIGIPARIAFAKIRNHRLPQELKEQMGSDILPCHGYTQLFLHTKWVSVTPAIDKVLCGQILVPPVEFDGKNDAMLPAIDLSGKPYVEYLEKYEPQADFPFDWLRPKVLRIWGEKRSWLSYEESRGHRMPSGYVF